MLIDMNHFNEINYLQIIMMVVMNNLLIFEIMMNFFMMALLYMFYNRFSSNIQ
jgi:hypothetical protein